jgi:prepilin-type processing-associated H-X9-DG protein
MEACVGFDWSQWSATPKLSDKLLSRHPGGVNVAFCDGHMQFISDNIDITAFKMLMTPYGNAIPRDGTDNTIMSGVPWAQTGATLSNVKTATNLLPPVNYLLDESKF